MTLVSIVLCPYKAGYNLFGEFEPFFSATSFVLHEFSMDKFLVGGCEIFKHGPNDKRYWISGLQSRNTGCYWIVGVADFVIVCALHL